MSAPAKFILAAPVLGNKYIHYLSLWVDMEKRVLIRTRDKHDWCYTNFSQLIMADDGAKRTAQKRLAGKIENLWQIAPITNGVANVIWVNDKANIRRRYPVRFEPYKACFVTHHHVTQIESGCFDDLLDRIDEKLKKLSFQLLDLWWNGWGKLEVSFDDLWPGIESDLEGVFNQLSPSQIKLVVDNNYGHGKKPSSLEEVYEPHKEREFRRTLYNRNPTHALDEFEAIFPIKKQAEERVAITKSISRHLRRTPSLATRRFLKMLAAMGISLKTA